MTSKLNLHQPNNVTLIRRYSTGKVQIRDTEYTHNLIVTPSEVLSWSLASFDQLRAKDFQAVIAQKPSLVLLGTGASLKFPSAEQSKLLLQAQIGLEVMDTAAACRTFNILADDGRRVVACLLL